MGEIIELIRSIGLLALALGGMYIIYRGLMLP